MARVARTNQLSLLIDPANIHRQKYTLSLSIQHSINHSKRSNLASGQLSANHLMKFHRQKPSLQRHVLPTKKKEKKKKGKKKSFVEHHIERARVSLLQREFSDSIPDGRLLLPAGQRAARRNASRDSRIGGEKAEKPTGRPTFNRAGLACYEPDSNVSNCARRDACRRRRAKEKGMKERGAEREGRGLLAVMKQGRPRRVGRKRTDLAGGQLNESRMSTRCVSCNSHPIVHSLTATVC